MKQLLAAASLAWLVFADPALASAEFVAKVDRVEIRSPSGCPGLYPPLALDGASIEVVGAYLAVNGLDGAEALAALTTATDLAARRLGRSAPGDLMFSRWLTRSTIRKLGERWAYDVLDELASSYQADQPWVATHIAIESAMLKYRADLRRSGSAPFVRKNLLESARDAFQRLDASSGPSQELARAWERLGDLFILADASDDAAAAYANAWNWWTDAQRDPVHRYRLPRMLCDGAEFGSFAKSRPDQYQGPYRVGAAVGADGKVAQIKILRSPYTKRWARRAKAAAGYALFRPAIWEAQPFRFEGFEFDFDPIPVTEPDEQ